MIILSNIYTSKLAIVDYYGTFINLCSQLQLMAAKKNKK